MYHLYTIQKSVSHCTKSGDFLTIENKPKIPAPQGDIKPAFEK